MRKKGEFNKEKQQQFLKALEQSYGVVSQASRVCGIHRSSHKRWYKEDQDYREAVNDLKNVALDFAEHNLLLGIQDQNMTAIIFYLKTQGKSRGYVERQEINQETTYKHEPVQMTAEEAKKYLDSADIA